MLVFAGTAPLAGIALDRWGPRPVFGLGVCLMALGLLLSSRATSLADLLLSYGVVEGIGLGITGLGPVASVVAGWTTPAQRGQRARASPLLAPAWARCSSSRWRIC